MNLDGHGKATVPRRTVRNSATTTVGTSATSITGLALSVEAGKSYKIKVVLSLSASPTDTGFGFTGPAVNFIRYSTTLSTATAFRVRKFTTVADADAADTDLAATLLEIEGIISPSANGTLQLRGIRTGTSLTADTNGFMSLEEF